jgi:Zn-dependent protease with chaperone function
MDFFEHQDIARRKTGWLVALFVVAVLAIIALVYVLVAVGLGFAAGEDGEINTKMLVRLDVLGVVGVGVLSVVSLGSLFKIAQLASSGGAGVAESLGGRRLAADSTDPTERRILNVVEEMAIASGTPVPPVYLMDRESGINAFAAGFSPSDAVIGITRGTINELTRDQLQGVVAHEFSHVLNGDMRLNIRLMGFIHGILVIGIIGYYIFRISAFSGGRRSGSGKDSSPIPLILLGLGLTIIGFVGTFFGNLIKAAISRQREFLADSSAVQFTRNPAGIAGALKVIGGYRTGSHVEAPAASEVSHMFFARAISSGLQSLLATHPPLDQRISRIDQSWQLQQDRRHAETAGATTPSAVASGFAGATTASASFSPAAHAPPTSAPVSAVRAIGEPTDAHVHYAQKLVASLPTDIVSATHETYGGRAVIYGLLLSKQASMRSRQFEQLERYADATVVQLTRRLLTHLVNLSPSARLPLVDMAIPALKAMSSNQYVAFRKSVDALIKADGQIELMEWALCRILIHHLDPAFGDHRPPRVKFNKLGHVSGQVNVLISCLAYVGSRRADDARHALDQAQPHVEPLTLKLLSNEECTLRELSAALSVVSRLSPSLKRQVLAAAAACVAADHEVTVSEAELFRAIADTLDCPVPPLLPGQPLV